MRTSCSASEAESRRPCPRCLPPPGLPEALAVRPGRFLRYRYMGAYVIASSTIVSGGVASIILLPLDSPLGDGLRMYCGALARVQY